MKKVIQYFANIFSQIIDAITNNIFKPINDWADNVATINILRTQFTCLAGSKYADAISPVIERLSAGSFEFKRDLWLVAIKDIRNGVDLVEIVYKFDLAAFDTDGYFDLMFRSKGS